MFKNWKTTSAGLLSIIGGVTTIVYASIAKSLTQEVLMAASAAILLGVGLIFAADATA